MKILAAKAKASAAEKRIIELASAKAAKHGGMAAPKMAHQRKAGGSIKMARPGESLRLG